MKNMTVLPVFFMVLLAVPFSLPAYEDSPANVKVLPECIWAAATGGGTWKTEIQLTNVSVTPATVNVYFYYANGNARGPFTLTTGLVQYHSAKYSNILQTIDGLDSGDFVYYGKVGAVRFYTTSNDSAPAVAAMIQVTAKTFNGNFGKSFPGLSVIAANTAAQNRPLAVPDMVNNVTSRTFTGFFNTSAAITYTVEFVIINATNNTVGSFSKTFNPNEYMAFNPFVEAGVAIGTYDNCWLYVNPTSGGSADLGIIGYGSIANNISNDPTALLAYPLVF